MDVVNVGLVGCGYWGPNLVRTFLEIPHAQLQVVADRDPAQLRKVRSRHPQIPEAMQDYRGFFDRDLDAVIVSTPPETHYEIVSECLLRGLDVFVEKPLTTKADEAHRLAQIAEDHGRILAVGHIGAYNPAVAALRKMIVEGELGDIHYIDAVRVGLGLFHPRLDVIWDLAPHDIAILLHLLDEAPVSVSTRAIACVQDAVEDVAYMTLMFPSGVLAHARMSWLDPCKTRRITVVGSRKMVVYDDLESHEKLKVYDKHVDAIRQTSTFGEFQFAYHYGSVVSPYIEFQEPLRLECLHFLDCVRNRTTPLTDGRNGAHVVEVVEAAHRSLWAGGAQVGIAAERALTRRRAAAMGAPLDGHNVANGGNGTLHPVGVPWS